MWMITCKCVSSLLLEESLRWRKAVYKVETNENQENKTRGNRRQKMVTVPWKMGVDEGAVTEQSRGSYVLGACRFMS